MLLGLLRHGIAEVAGPATGYRDQTRHLTADGARRIREESAGMRRLGLRADAVLTSPLDRCLETAQIVAAALDATVRAHVDLRPGARAGALLGIVAEYPDAGCVLACGHQPDLSLITRELTGGTADYGRGALGLIELDALQPGRGTLVGLYPAKVLRRVAGAP